MYRTAVLAWQRLLTRLFERRADAVESGIEAGADAVDGGDDHNADAHRDERIFDGGRTGIIPEKFCQ